MDLANIDPNKLTIAEVEVIEEVTGLSMERAFSAEAPKAKLLRALAFVTKRREDPSFTLEQAGELTLADIGVATEVAEDPTSASAL